MVKNRTDYMRETLNINHFLKISFKNAIFTPLEEKN